MQQSRNKAVFTEKNADALSLPSCSSPFALAFFTKKKSGYAARARECAGLSFYKKTNLYMRTVLTLICAACVAASCSKDQSASEAEMDFVIKFDATQPRLNNIGQAASIPAGNAAQTPQFHEMSIHYIELAPNALTPLGQGAVVYHAEEVTTGGAAAVDFDRAAKAGDGQSIFKMKLKELPPGTYE